MSNNIAEITLHSHGRATIQFDVKYSDIAEAVRAIESFAVSKAEIDSDLGFAPLDKDERESSEAFANWLADCSDLGPDYSTESRELRHSWEKWAASNGVDKIQWGASIKARFGNARKSHNFDGLRYVGVRIRPEVVRKALGLLPDREAA